MKIFFFRFYLMLSLSLCLTMEASNGMGSCEIESAQLGGHKRALLTGKGDIDKSKTEFPYHLIEQVCDEITKFFSSDLKIQQAQLNTLRLVSSEFKRIVDHGTICLDLSGFNWVPHENRPQNGQFSHAKECRKSGVNHFSYSNNQLSILKSKKVNTGYFSEFAGYVDVWIPCSPELGRSLWNSQYIYYKFCSYDYESERGATMSCHREDGDYRVEKNPFITFFTDISRDFKELPNLTSLNLNYNTAIQDGQLSFLSNLKRLTLVGNSNITDESVSRLTNLTSLSLEKNKTITDESVSRLTNLISLSLEKNETITDNSVSCLLKLEDLTLGWDNGDEPKIKLNTLHCLPNLKILTLGVKCQDTGECFNFPSLKELRFSGTEDWIKMYQQAIYIADALFLYMESKKDETNYMDVSALKEQYKSEIMLPIIQFELTSKILDENASASYTLQDMRKLIDIATDEDDGEYCDERTTKISTIIKTLREFSEIDLKILRSSNDSDDDNPFIDICDSDNRW